jgi:hypothetical protein
VQEQSKNRDKQLTHIVRVIVSVLFFSLVSVLLYVNNHGDILLQALLKALFEHQPARLLKVLASKKPDVKNQNVFC